MAGRSVRNVFGNARRIVIAGVAALLGVGLGLGVNAYTGGAATSAVEYQCVSSTGIVRANTYSHEGSPVTCPVAGDHHVSFSVSDLGDGGVTTTTQGPTTTTTKPVTTTTTVPPTTTTTVPNGTCTGVNVTQASDISQANTTYCITGTHNWTIHPRSGDTIAGGILDGGNNTGFAVVADPCVTNVTLSGIEIRNYTVNGGDFRGAITAQDTCESGWHLNNLQVHDIGVAGSGGAGAELVSGWVVTGGRYYNERQEGLTNGAGHGPFTVDGAELDHNNFADDTYSSPSVSCGHEAGGMKFVASGVTIKNSYVHDNSCMGLWSDIGSDHITITGNTIANNWNSGMQIEISINATITNNTVTGNAFSTFGSFHSGCNDVFGAGILNSDSGIYSGTSGTILISGNTVSHNCNGIMLADGLSTGDCGSGCGEVANTTVSNNTVVGCDSSNCTAAEVALAHNHTGYSSEGDGDWPDGNSFSGNVFSHGAIFCGSTC